MISVSRRDGTRDTEILNDGEKGEL
jgi:hypothetical protein